MLCEFEILFHSNLLTFVDETIEIVTDWNSFWSTDVSIGTLMLELPISILHGQ